MEGVTHKFHFRVFSVAMDSYTDDDDITIDLSALPATTEEAKEDEAIRSEMCAAAAPIRKHGLPIYSSFNMERTLLDISLRLPPYLREGVMQTHQAYADFLEALRDTVEAWQEELDMLHPDRPCLAPFNAARWSKLPHRYQQTFGRLRKHHQIRREKLARRIQFFNDKIRYLEDMIEKRPDGLPPAPLPCDLCRVGGTITLVTESEQPRCSNDDCKYVLCEECLKGVELSLTGPFFNPKCPGCRAPFAKTGPVVERKKRDDPFFPMVSMVEEDALVDDEEAEFSEDF